MSGALRYWHTLRHLRPVQFYGRLRFRLARPSPDLRPPPALRARTGRWENPAPHHASLVGPDRLRLLNATHALSEHGWDSPTLDKLWRYNLHYFDDLTAPSRPQRSDWQRALMLRWVRENPPARGTGWEPYPTSLRIVNWVKWVLAGDVPSPEMVTSLAVQARWLARRLEVHLLGNHLFANAKALVFAGSFFEGSEAERWLETGMRLLAREVPEQILEDGGQFERSPMYHSIALEDLLDLLNITQAYPAAIQDGWRLAVADWRRRTGAMRQWLTAMTHPDGEISFFNDAAFGIAPAPALLDAYARRLGCIDVSPVPVPIANLAASGYIRLDSGDVVALLDVAPVGPDYLPGHAHADTLSFELSLFGERLLVNSGTSRYGADDERLRQRGTAAHNTVVVDGENSSDVWGGFRVARRARPTPPSIRAGSPIVVECSHDGYLRLPGRVVHTRTWELGALDVTITDRLAGRWSHGEARYHVHPRVHTGEREHEGSDASLTLTLSGGRRVRFIVERGDLRVEPATWHPSFGSEESAACLVVRLRGEEARVRLVWEQSP